MRRWVVLAFLTALAIGATVAIASADWGDGHGSQGVTGVQGTPPAAPDETIQATAVATKEKFLDNDRNHRDSVGDVVLVRFRLNDDAGEGVGKGNVTCELHFRAFVCHAVFKIAGRGQIVVHGDVGRRGSFDVPVTGGTGDFADVGGWLHVEALRRDREALTFSLYHFARQPAGANAG